MTNIATVRYEADSSQVKAATKDLKDQTQASKGLEAANDKMNKASNRVANAQGKMANAASKAGRDIKAANDNIARSSRGAGKAFDFMKDKIVKGGALIGAAIVAAFSVRPLFEFTTALAEVSTLVDTSTFNMVELSKASLAQSASYGGGAAQQAKAFYSIISAGAGTAAKANDILTASNKLAIGGVTNVAVAADGLTSILNAYGNKVESATAVSDAMFVAMRAGKTTIGELSGSLGKVAPLAAQTGVSFDELLASISALTKGGISTQEAVTGVRAVLAAVAKPSSEAQKLAAKLGIEFNAAGLKAKGFADFVSDLVDKTNGSTDALAQLFGGVEALVPVMALSGQAGIDFYNILDQMENKAGQTQIAFDKMAKSPAFQAGRVWSSLQAEVLGVSSSLGGPLAAALKAVADNMDLIVASVAIFTAGHLAAAIVPIIASVGSLALGLGTAATAAGALKVAMAFAGGPIGLAIMALASGYMLLTKSTREFEAAMDRATIAMGDEIKQVQILGTLLSKQEIMTLSTAKTKLEEAEARRKNILAMIEENTQLVKSSDAYRSTIEHINNARAALNAMAPAGSDADKVPLRMRDAYEEMQKSLSQSLKTQREMLSVTTDGNIALSDNAKNIERLKVGIENAKNGMVRLNGEWVEGVGLSDRLNTSTNNVSNSLANAANNANTLAGGLANAAGYAANLSSFLGGLESGFANTKARIAGLTAGLGALTSGQGRAASEVAKYRKELEASLPPMGSMQDGQRKFVQNMINEKVKLFSEEKRLSGAYQQQLSALNKIKTASGRAGKSAKSITRSAYANAVSSLQGGTKDLQFEATLIGLPDAQVTKLRKEQELLNAALQDGKQLTPELRGTISGLAQEYSVAEQHVNGLKAANDNYLQAVETGKGITKNALGAFFDDLREGKGVWESMKSAAIGALDSISKKLADMAANNLVESVFGGAQAGGGGLGGIFSSLFGGGGGGGASIMPGLFASGGYTGNGAVSAAAGIVHGQEFVNNAASTAKYRPHLEAMNNGNWTPPVMAQPVPVPVASNNNQSIKVVIGGNIKVTVDDDKFKGEMVELSAQVVRASTPSIVEQSTKSSINAYGKGGFDTAASGRFGQTPKANIR